MFKKIFLAAGVLLALSYGSTPALAANDCTGAAVPGMVVGPDGSGGCTRLIVNSDGSINTSGGGGGGGNVTVINPIDANGNVQVNPVDSGGTSMTNTADHAINAHITNNGVTAGTPVAGQTYAPIGETAVTNCSGQALTNAQIYSGFQDILGNTCVKSSPQVANTVNGSGSATGTSSTQCIAATASKVTYVTSFDITNSNASAFVVTLQDGSGGTALWTGNVPAGGGITKFGVTPLLHTTSGNGLFFAVTGGGSTVYCNASGFSQ